MHSDNRKELIERIIISHVSFTDAENTQAHVLFASRTDEEIVEIVRVGLAQLAGRSTTDMDRSNSDRVFPSKEVFKESLYKILDKFMESIDNVV